MSTETASPSYARPPTDELSSTLWSALTEAELGGEQPFDTRDLCLLVALAARSGAAVPSEYAGLLAAAFAQLGLPTEPTREQIDAAVKQATDERPLDPRLLGALDRFREVSLAEAAQRTRLRRGAALLGRDAEPARAPGVEERPTLTAQQLMHRRSPGKNIIR